MGIYRAINLDEHRASTLVLNHIEDDIRNLDNNRIGTIYKYDLEKSLKEFKKHVDCDMCKCSVSIAVIEAATLAFCGDLIATGKDNFKQHALELCLDITYGIGGADYSGPVYKMHKKLIEEKECIAKTSRF